MSAASGEAVGAGAAVEGPGAGPQAVATKRSAAEKGFSVLWGALLHSRRAYEIDSGLWRDEHISRKEWGFLLNLVRYSAVDGTRELRLFWILPFRSTSRTRE